MVGGGGCQILVMQLDEGGDRNGTEAVVAVGERGNAQGPKTDHLLQASLNGVAVDADEVVIGYLAKEALSVNVAARKGFGEIARFAAEWTMQRDQFEPIAAAEAARVKGILAVVDQGQLPARKFPAGELPAGAEIVDPNTGRWEVHRDGKIADTPKPGDPLFDRVQTLVVASNDLAAEAEDGLHEGDVVIVHPGDRITEGVSVTAR